MWRQNRRGFTWDDAKDTYAPTYDTGMCSGAMTRGREGDEATWRLITWIWGAASGFSPGWPEQQGLRRRRAAISSQVEETELAP